MKFLHTSDWHLGKRLEDFSRLEEQQAVLQEICEIADRENVDAVVICGDLFDTYNPPTEAVDLFYKTLKKLANNGKRPVIAIAGNHDSADRIESPDPLARECGIIFAGFPHTHIAPFELESRLKISHSAAGFIELQIPSLAYPFRIITTPYANELRLKTFLGVEESEEELRLVLQKHWADLAQKYCDKKGVNIMASHLLFIRKGDELPEESEDEKPILYVGGAQAIYTENIPPAIQYVALGHLHRKQTAGTVPCPVVYTGSPLAYSFSEANQDKYVIIVEAEPGEKVVISEILLKSGKKLVRKRFDEIDAALEWLNQNPDIFIELTMVSETYLATNDRKLLLGAHKGIISIIPEMRKLDQKNDLDSSAIDLSKNMEDLFTDFFKYKKGQLPNERMLNLFKEVISQEDVP